MQRVKSVAILKISNKMQLRTGEDSHIMPHLILATNNMLTATQRNESAACTVGRLSPTGV